MVNLSDPDNPIAEAYLSNESGGFEIYIRSFPEPGGLTRVSQGGGAVPFWSPDGNTLYYVAPGGVFMAARLQRDPVPVVLSTDALFTLTGGGVEPFPGSALHPDGDRFILARTPARATAPDGDALQPDPLILVQNFFEELGQVVPD